MIDPLTTIRSPASALKFLRDRDLIHRDIKPQNLLLEPSSPADAPIPTGVPLLKIADFGFARSLPNAALAETLCVRRGRAESADESQLAQIAESR